MPVASEFGSTRSSDQGVVDRQVQALPLADVPITRHVSALALSESMVTSQVSAAAFSTQVAEASVPAPTMAAADRKDVTPLAKVIESVVAPELMSSTNRASDPCAQADVLPAAATLDTLASVESTAALQTAPAQAVDTEVKQSPFCTSPSVGSFLDAGVATIDSVPLQAVGTEVKQSPFCTSPSVGSFLDAGVATIDSVPLQGEQQQQEVPLICLQDSAGSYAQREENLYLQQLCAALGHQNSHLHLAVKQNHHRAVSAEAELMTSKHMLSDAEYQNLEMRGRLRRLEAEVAFLAYSERAYAATTAAAGNAAALASWRHSFDGYR
eukprot:TRINITY_DN10087_c1_g1_i8.p1 TRINITY_DN10087_c1_g1~~TRINITY_DN10087_c1_g1_i8.p1  ORF type:complete len:381 (-),score=69.30 TRINITY_DN10087_c1_g1_i8:96-1070(-)